MKALVYLGVGLGMIVLAGLISLVAAIPTVLLWNWLMPAIFGIARITFWQAWGINWLAAILFQSRIYLPRHD